MDSLSLTVLLAVVNFLICSVAFFLKPYPIVTIFHLTLLSSFITYGIRPLFSALLGGFTLYPTPLGWSAYNLGLLYSLLFTVPYVATYLLLRTKKSFNQKAISLTGIRLSFFSVLLTLFTGAIAVLAIHVLSQGRWLPVARNQTITSVVPFGKILFPSAVIPLSVSIPALVLILFRYRHCRIKFIFVVVLLVCVSLLLILLYQRGFFLSGILWSVFLYERIFKKLTYRKAFIVGLICFLSLFILRPFAVFIASGGKTKPDISLFLKKNFLFAFAASPNFDAPDVWQVFVWYVSEHGYLEGKSFYAFPARFLRPIDRLELDLKTSVDLINEFYWGEIYWETNFAFAVSSAQEIYLNFGPILIPCFAVLSGLWTYFLDSWLYRFRRVTLFRLFLIVVAFKMGSLGGELAQTVQWAVGYAIVGMVLSFPEEIALKQRAKNRNLYRV
ncbi:MAG: hypothetical protein ABIM21_07455 [candidate division WOR-3 bacterium]